MKDFFAATGSGDKQGLLALAAENIEWIIPGEGWPLAGTHRGHAELAAVLRKAFEEVEMTYPEPVVAKYSFRGAFCGSRGYTAADQRIRSATPIRR